MSRSIQKVFLLYMFLSYLVCVPSLKSINSSSLTRKKYGEVISFPHSSTITIRNQNKLVGIRSTELTEPSDTRNYKPYFKHCVLQTVLHAFFIV